MKQRIAPFGYIITRYPTSTISLAFFAASATGGELGCRQEKVVKCQNGHEAPIYVTQGEPPQVVYEKELRKEINKKYPDWYRGKAPDGLADEDSHHFYYTFMGPGADKKGGIHAENLSCYSYYLRPGKLYPAHNHPSREFYYVMGGEATFHSGGREIEASKGTFIMHPPYTSHAIVNTSKTELFEAMVCWWAESGDAEDWHSKGGLMTNPCLVQHQGTANPKRIVHSECSEPEKAGE